MAAATAAEAVGRNDHMADFGREVRIVSQIDVTIQDRTTAGPKIADIEKNEICGVIFVLHLAEPQLGKSAEIAIVIGERLDSGALEDLTGYGKAGELGVSRTPQNAAGGRVDMAWYGDSNAAELRRTRGGSFPAPFANGICETLHQFFRRSRNRQGEALVNTAVQPGAGDLTISGTDG
ncbi:MAG TPA: hypothetical protein VH369_20445 [Bryobacteraceae bacterium]